MVKKLLAAFIALAVVFSPVGGSLIHDGSNVASAKGYKSGKRSFDSGSNNQSSLFKNNNSNSVKQNNTSKNSSSKSTAASSKRGGLMKGLLMGGIAAYYLEAYYLA